MSNANKKYEQFHARANNTIQALKSELIAIVKDQCVTYDEAEKSLIAQKRIAVWKGDLVIKEVIDDVIRDFNDEKNGLSIK